MAFGRDDVCEHGSLERKCDICSRDKRIAELETALKNLLDANRLEGTAQNLTSERWDEVVTAALAALGEN